MTPEIGVKKWIPIVVSSAEGTVSIRYRELRARSGKGSTASLGRDMVMWEIKYGSIAVSYR
jgi:hypothetical protein